MQMSDTNLATINISRITSDDRRRLLLSFCQTSRLDVVALQEVPFARCPILESSYSLISNPGPHKIGTAILVRSDLASEVLEVRADPDGRLLAVRFPDFVFVSVYAPSGRRNREDRNIFFRSTLPAFVSQWRSPLLLAGDFNAIDNLADRVRPSAAPQSALIDKPLIDLVAGLALTDMWTSLRRGEAGHSYFHKKGSARLDRFYATAQLVMRLSNVSVASAYVSDHFVLRIQLSRSTPVARFIAPPPVLWKLNTSVLSEEMYVAKIDHFLGHAIAHPLKVSDLLLWWETIFKPGVRKVTQDYCRFRARRIRETRAFYAACLADLALEVGSSEEGWSRFQSLRDQAVKWDLYTLEGARVRSRLVAAEDVDTPSVFHINQERTNGSRSGVSSLSVDGQLAVTDPAAVEGLLTDHFHSIFSRPIPTDPTLGVDFLSGVVGTARLPPSFDCSFSLSELTDTLHRLPSGSSPGDDGLPREFYAAFWPVIGPVFLEMFLEVLKKGSLTPSQGSALIRLIPKLDVPQKPADFRPISLLNCDYKLMAGVLAGRLKRTLDKTLGVSQRGGVPGRRLIDNLSLYRDAIAFMEERTERLCPDMLRDPIGPSGAVIGIDLEKAYDLVDRPTLWLILATMGYPAVFIGHLKTLYSVATMSVLNGSRIAGTVPCRNSVRQGCPLSVHLYVLYLEPLLARFVLVMKGIPLLDLRLTVRAYVDDLAAFVETADDLVVMDATLSAFCTWTGSRVNRVKTKALGLGRWAGRVTWPLPWLQSSSPLTLLGVPFSTSIEETGCRVWNATLGHLHGILRTNISRRFSLYQRVQFIKTAAISRSVYVGQILQCPSDVVDKLHSAIMRFLWSGRLVRPQPAVSYRLVKTGGLGMVDVALFLRALFIRPILSSLLGPVSIHQGLLRYWLAFPTRAVFPFIVMPCVRSVLLRNFYLSSLLPSIRQLVSANLVGPDGPKNHRVLYNFWVSLSSCPGTVESLWPSWDWPSVWKRTAALPHDVRESLFLFNHRLLFTRERANRLNPVNSPLCLLCNCLPETDIHLFLECPSRTILSSWLQTTLLNLGSIAPLPVIIHGEIGPGPSSHHLFLLIAAYVHVVWKTRTRRRLPTVGEVQSCWVRLKNPSDRPP